MVDCCEIFTQEVTEEIYKYLVDIINTLRYSETERKVKRNDICRDIILNGIFLNQKFTCKSIKHKIIKCSLDKIK